jgi:predicted lysophospholipase L1 biosynthesis ABC-type transport system permease subunit
MIDGRDFAAADTAGAPRVVIVASAIAQRLWPNERAVGKRLKLDTFNARTRRSESWSASIVAVVGDIRSSSLVDGLAEPYVYLPVAQSADTGMTTEMSVVARSRTGKRIDRDIATAIAQLDPNLVVVRDETLEQAIAFGLAPQRVLTAVAGTLGLVGLLLASLGVYALVAYAVACRRREFGIRLALGAQRAAIVRMVFTRGMRLIGIGMAIGLALAMGAGQVISIFLYGLTPVHMPTLITAAALFACVGGLACYLPARQAVRLEPLAALRTE